MFLPRLPERVSLDELGPHCHFLNWQEVYDAGYWMGQVRSPLPTIQLKLTLESFDLDCFSWQTRILVSERLRDAMALDSSAVQYFDVDASQSAAVPRAKNYKVLNVAVTEDIADVGSSNYQMGSLIPGGRSMVSLLKGVAFRPDAKPQHSLFCEKFFAGHLFCTDDLAVRVLRAGCTGVQFLGTAQLHLAGTIRYRTLQGVEESVWDPDAEIRKTRLVEALD